MEERGNYKWQACPNGSSKYCQTNSFNGEIIASVVIFLSVGFFGWLSYYIFEHYFSRWAQKTATTLDDDILAASKSFVVIFIILIGLHYAISPLSFLDSTRGQFDQALLVVEIFFTAFAVTQISNILVDWYTNKRAGAKGKTFLMSAFFLRK